MRIEIYYTAQYNAISKEIQHISYILQCVTFVAAYTPLAKTRSWYNTLTTYRLQGVSAEVVEAGAPAAMKNTADIMVPFLAYLASDEASNISGMLFKLAADGEIGVWSDSEVISCIKKEEGPWTIDELRNRVSKELLKGVETVKTFISLK